MRYEQKPSFIRSIKKFDDSKKDKIKDSVRQLVIALEKKQTPQGLGLKHLRKNFWEIRVNIRDRVIFRLSNDLVEFIIAGDHDDISNFLKNV